MSRQVQACQAEPRLALASQDSTLPSDHHTGIPQALLALEARLRQAAPHITAERSVDHSLDTEQRIWDHLDILLAAVADPSRMAQRWLLLTAVLMRFPTTAQLLAFTRMLSERTADSCANYLLDQALATPAHLLMATMRIVTDQPVVDVGFTACHDTHTGIPRVVRETLSRWEAAHAIVPVAWTQQNACYRSLLPGEHDRVFHFGQHSEQVAQASAYDWAMHAQACQLIVPFGTTLVCPDVAVTNQATAALAQFSGNTVSYIAYDLIPLTAADLRPAVDVEATARWFATVKHAHKVAGISASATAEMAGMVSALPTQGLQGPDVRQVELPAQASHLPPQDTGADKTNLTSTGPAEGLGHTGGTGPSGGSGQAGGMVQAGDGQAHEGRAENGTAGDDGAAGRRPVIALIGTLEPHKNQRTVLHAAHRLWHEGLDFEVRQIGGRGWDTQIFDQAASRLIADGFPLTLMGRVSEQTLWDQLRAADAAVFISLHEGYGLPVAEALSVGTPVITSNYGSQAQIASHGGCLTVDPRDDASVTHALRRIITQPELRAQLVDQIAHRPTSTWDNYADSLWAYLVEGAH